MKTYLDCIPCFFRQVLEGSKIIGASPKAQKRIIDEFAGIIPEVSLNSTPPEIARFGYKLLEKISRDGDPYKKIKQKSNRLVLKLYGKLKNKVRRSRDRLLEAVELAIAGNVIDFGVKNTLNLNEELRKILSGEKKSVHKRNIFHYADFKQALRTKGDILYLADNAGEVVFDRILIEEIRRKYPEKIIYFAVKDKPIINDALFEDAKACGIDKMAKIISNGSDAPGTIISLCSKEFRRIYRKARMVISKGQGNFETLSQEKKAIFFLFMVKCQVVAKHTHCKLGDKTLFCNLNTNRAYKKSGFNKIIHHRRQL